MEIGIIWKQATNRKILARPTSIVFNILLDMIIALSF